ncbi:MAG: gamma-glutamyltransferase [Bacteroidales bacterium]|nr:gamma-glutamyltransferase [Bacteroidales bacterium]
MRLQLVIVFGFWSFALQAAPPRAVTHTTQKGVVVCVSPPAADVGARILKAGGNAVDAAIAVGFAQAVTWPEAGNIGGGGFMVIRPADGQKPVVVEYREKAPAAATENLWVRGVQPLSHKAAGVPGTVRGMALAHAKFGKLPWKDLLAPAIQLAEGMTINDALARSLNQVLANSRTKNAEFHRVFDKPGGGTWAKGDRLTQPDLARTLKRIAEQGADAFYTGELAQKLAQEMKSHGGLITVEDLAAYTAQLREPVRGHYRGCDIITVSPPSGGGIVLVETLNILEQFPLAEQPRYAPRTVHLITEAMRRAYADRARYLGDPDFTKIPAFLTSKEHAQKLAATIDPNRATPSAKVAPDIPLVESGGETTHYSVIDSSGMCVSNTYTLENSFGNRVVVPGAGYILNNEMTDFNPIPGRTDRTGRIGTPPNLIAPGKRMLSSQTPTILVRDGKPVLITGSPGGRTIPNTVICIVINVVDYGMPVGEAVSAPRQHHQWFPDRLDHEDFAGFPQLAEALQKMGHIVAKRGQGDGHSIGIDPKTGLRTAAADRRRDGQVATEK